MLNIVSRMRHPRPDLELRRTQAETLLDLNRIRHASERRAERMLQEIGLQGITPAQSNVLMLLFQERKPMTASRLADGMGLSVVTVGRFIKALDQEGWVTRERDPSDSRAILVAPSDKAAAALPRFIEVSNRLLDTAFADFSPAQIAQIGVVTARVRANLEQDTEGPHASRD